MSFIVPVIYYKLRRMVLAALSCKNVFWVIIKTEWCQILKTLDSARTVARVFAVFPDDSTIDHNLLNPPCVSNRVIISCNVRNGIRIKNHQVGKVSRL